MFLIVAEKNNETCVEECTNVYPKMIQSPTKLEDDQVQNITCKISKLNLKRQKPLGGCYHMDEKVSFLKSFDALEICC